jgi:hypothetical protein
LVVVGEREDTFASVGGADSEVVHASGAAEGHAAVLVGSVVAQAVVAGVVLVVGGDGLGGGAVGVAGGAPAVDDVGRVAAVESQIGDLAAERRSGDSGGEAQEGLANVQRCGAGDDRRQRCSSQRTARYELVAGRGPRSTGPTPSSRVASAVEGRPRVTCSISP